MTDRSQTPILCFGEVLWDSVPQGLFPGGAPVNVAYHLKQFGWNAVPVTAVGEDFLGTELLRRMRRWELATEFVTSLPNKSTGVVLVELSPGGGPAYEILEDVAWDWIALPQALLDLAPESWAIVYGTLAQRAPHNRKQFDLLLEHAPKAKRIYDVNMRPPFDSPEIIWPLARKASLIKINHEELLRLVGQQFENDELEKAARALAKETGVGEICVTAGASGAGLLLGDRWHWVDARRVNVRDTIGAGDSFLAALIHGLLTEPENPHGTLYRACRLAEFVASRDGATPAYDVSREGEILPK